MGSTPYLDRPNVAPGVTVAVDHDDHSRSRAVRTRYYNRSQDIRSFSDLVKKASQEEHAKEIVVGNSKIRLRSSTAKLLDGGRAIVTDRYGASSVGAGKDVISVKSFIDTMGWFQFFSDNDKVNHPIVKGVKKGNNIIGDPSDIMDVKPTHNRNFVRWHVSLGFDKEGNPLTKRLRDAIGKVNRNRISIGSTSFPPGTVRFEGVDMKASVGSYRGAWGFSIAEEPYGWYRQYQVKTVDEKDEENLKLAIKYWIPYGESNFPSSSW